MVKKGKEVGSETELVQMQCGSEYLITCHQQLVFVLVVLYLVAGSG